MMMKKIYSFVCTLLLFFLNGSPLSVTANAEILPSYGSYACILQDAYFCSNPDEQSGLFLLPKTYYVKLIEYQTDFCKIEYLYDSASTQKIVGYARTDELTFVDYTPKRPYLYYVFNVQYLLDTSPAPNSSFLNQITVSCAYYGDFKVGVKTYCYVLRGEEFGYVPKPETLLYEENTEYADRLPPPAEDVPTPTEQKKSNSAQIAILIALCLLVPVLASLIVKPPKRPPYEEE